MLEEICFDSYYRVWFLIQFISNVFHFIINLFKNQSDMCKTKAVAASISKFFLVAASVRMYQAHTKNRVGHHSKIKSQGCENDYMNYCLNSGECYYLVDEDIAG